MTDIAKAVGAAMNESVGISSRSVSAPSSQATGQTGQSGTTVLDCPPVCDCCERMVMETSSKPVLLGCDAMLCTDCWYEWYDGDCSTEDGSGRSSERIKENVLRECGRWGGHAGIGMDRAAKFGLLNGMEKFIYEQSFGERKEQ